MSAITRRDFVNGTLIAAGGALLPAGAQSMSPGSSGQAYPPSKTGLRGSHPGSNEAAHRLAWGSSFQAGSVHDIDEHYDLIVVGAGLSGLAAAYFYRQQYGAGKKILLLDNHDDFGGHAKRNEHSIAGRTLISYGGSQTLVEPSLAPTEIKGLFADIGVDLQRFDEAFDQSFYRRHGLGAVTYFNDSVFGRDTVVRHPFCNYYNYIQGLPGAAITDEEAVAQAPLGARGKQQLLQVLRGGTHLLALQGEALEQYLQRTNYFEYLQTVLGVDDPAVLRMARHSGLDWSNAGTELLTVAEAKECGALGFAPVPVYDSAHPYIHHFPDGNAGVARALVKHLIPDVAVGDNAEDLVAAKFDYGRLDHPASPVKIRLRSTVVNVAHRGDPRHSDRVDITYQHGQQARRVSSKRVVMACYNVMIPHLIPDLPAEQAAALRLQSKSPLIYTTVGLRQWRAFKSQGIGMAMCPGNMHQAVLMDFPVSMGGYQFTESPDEPCVIQMISCPYSEVPGKPREEQYKEARYRMLSREFDHYEAELRTHLGGMLDRNLFDFDRDIASITVNRWAHGYTVAGPGDSVSVGRQPFGRIAIANADSAPGADAIMAMAMGYRAVGELK